jgi:hypothetical protein
VDAAYEDAAPFCGLNITTGYDEMALIVAAGDVDTLADHFTYAAMKIGVVLVSHIHEIAEIAILRKVYLFKVLERS